MFKSHNTSKKDTQPLYEPEHIKDEIKYGNTIPFDFSGSEHREFNEVFSFLDDTNYSGELFKSNELSIQSRHFNQGMSKIEKPKNKLIYEQYIEILPNNTFKINDQIFCKDGYYGDDTISWRGCWKCNYECDINAKCFYPGVCVCNNYFYGDGIHYCNPHIPYIQEVDVINENVKIVVNGIDPKYELEKLYMKIDNQIFRSYLSYNRTSIFNISFVPKALKISLDAIHWTNLYHINNENSSNYSCYVILLLIFLILSAYLIISLIPARFLHQLTLKSILKSACIAKVVNLSKL